MNRSLVGAILSLAAASLGGEPPKPIYPAGTRFPLVLYSIHTVEEMKEVEPAGWNVGHRYSFKESYFDKIEEAGWLSVAHIEGKVKTKTPAKPAPKKGNDDATAANLEEADGAELAVPEMQNFSPFGAKRGGPENKKVLMIMGTVIAVLAAAVVISLVILLVKLVSL